MFVNTKLRTLICMSLVSTLAFCNDEDPIAYSFNLRPVVALSGGYASLNPGNSQLLPSVNQVPQNSHQAQGKNTGFVGGLLGVETLLPWSGPWPDYFIQTGIEYNYFGSVNATGYNTVSTSPSSLVVYHYAYSLQSQQVLASAKGFATYHKRFHPYVLVGLGAAFNQLGPYAITDEEPGALDLVSTTSNTNTTQFSYALAAGFDADVDNSWRVGCGYRYSNLGQARQGSGVIAVNNIQYPASFSVGASHAFANQFLVQVTYLPFD
ncbi:MAG: hypothetical protein B7X00_01125 [Legionella sp. 21-45-4]|nr:MAG: hypothetical protein B7X00_01125 [Legionella sp. 21-45-4]